MGDGSGTFEDPELRRSCASAWDRRGGRERRPTASRSSHPPAIAPTASSTPAPTSSCECSARPGSRADDGVALLCSNRAEFADVWAACQRGGFRLTTVNWHLTGDEAAYIVDRLRGQGVRGRVVDGRRGAEPPARPRTGTAAVGRRRHRGVHLARRRHRRRRRPTDRRPEPRHGNALHERHDRSAQGRRSTRRPRRLGDGAGAVRLRRRAPRPPLHRAALSRRALLHLADTAVDGGCAARVDGGVGRRGVPAADRRASREPHPRRAHDVPPHVGAARPTFAVATTCRRCSPSCTERHPARYR